MILGIETSCDDTSAAVIDLEGRLLSNIVNSQHTAHQNYGGIVPEIASREHLTAMTHTVSQALAVADIQAHDLSALAVTQGPGLVGSLLVGVHFARSLGLSLQIPVYPVHHHRAHIVSGLFELPRIPYPIVALVVSGGHTHLYRMDDLHTLEKLGQTRDDAAGEAFDKAATLLGLGFPGGPAIEMRAKLGRAVPHMLPHPKVPGLDMSFSGLKTALAYTLRDLVSLQDTMISDLAATFQDRVVAHLIQKIQASLESTRARGLLICGGVSQNKVLRQRAQELTTAMDIPCYLPPASLCTDNGAMIAASAWMDMKSGRLPPPDFETLAHFPLTP